MIRKKKKSILWWGFYPTYLILLFCFLNLGKFHRSVSESGEINVIIEQNWDSDNFSGRLKNELVIEDKWTFIFPIYFLYIPYLWKLFWPITTLCSSSRPNFGKGTLQLFTGICSLSEITFGHCQKLLSTQDTVLLSSSSKPRRLGIWIISLSADKRQPF